METEEELKKLAIQSPSPDEVANRAVEQHPRFPHAVKAAKVINTIGLGGAGLTVVVYVIKAIVGWYSPLLDIAPLILIILMPLLILIVAAFHGLIGYNIRISIPNPSVFPAMFSISVALLLYGSLPTHVEYLPMLKAAGILALFLVLLVFLSTPEFKKLTKLDIGNLLGIFSLLFSYSYGAYTTSNCALDNQPPKILSTIITEKYISRAGDANSYYLYFVPVKEIDVNRMEASDVLYWSVEKGDSLYIKIKPGRWHSPWYYMSAEP